MDFVQILCIYSAVSYFAGHCLS